MLFIGMYQHQLRRKPLLAAVATGQSRLQCLMAGSTRSAAWHAAIHLLTSGRITQPSYARH